MILINKLNYNGYSMKSTVRILLTGGNGFIGRNILESYLAEQYTILAPPHRELELLDEDAVRDYIKRNSISIVIHSAIKPGHRNAKDSSNLVYNNTRMFFNLARNEDLFDKLIFLGSGSVYDMRHYQPKMKEEYFDTHVPVDDTGFPKYICSKYIQKMEKGIDLRIFGIFGKHEDYSIRFISNMICKALFNLPLTINQNRKFDYLYIDDLIQVLEYIIDHDTKYRAYNITPDETVELHSLASYINSITGKNLPIIIKNDDMGIEYSGDNLLIKNEIKNILFSNINISIRQLMDWYKKNINNINKSNLLTDK